MGLYILRRVIAILTLLNLQMDTAELYLRMAMCPRLIVFTKLLQ
jgi:hypothetical protein